MLSGAASNLNNEGDSAMPGSYERFRDPTESRLSGGRTPFPQLPLDQQDPAISMRPPYPRLPPGRPSPNTPFPRLPPEYPAPRTSLRQPAMRPPLHPVRHHRHRRRAPLPDVVIERRPHHHHHSRRRGRAIAIPFDHRPTLGLRGPPKQILEIERVRCHRHRRPRYDCYDYEYDYDDHYDPSWSHPPPQIVPTIAHSVVNPQVPLVQPTLVMPSNNVMATPTSAVLPHLTPEIIENLPRQTVVLPPIHLPGSQANEQTELNTVVFPAELINPVDGSLSIIQADPGHNMAGGVISHPSIATPLQSLLANSHLSPTRQSALPARSADPLVNRFNEIFQRLTIPGRQPMSHPVSSNISQLHGATNPPINPQPSNTINTRLNQLLNASPTSLANNALYRPANTIPYSSANITPSAQINNQSYRPANIAPYESSTFTPSAPINNRIYGAANITPYSSSTFTPSPSINNMAYRPTYTAQPNTSEIGPYSPANITTYANNPLSQSSSSPMLNSYAPAASVASSRSFTPFPVLSTATTSSQANNPMPRSILRNPLPSSSRETVWTRMTPPNVSSSNEEISRTA